MATLRSVDVGAGDDAAVLRVEAARIPVARSAGSMYHALTDVVKLPPKGFEQF